jgi:predicted transcriptional regulator of viral defense system
VTTLAAAQEGVVTRAQLAAAGVPATTVSRWVEQGRLTRHRRGVFVVSASPATPMRPLWMAVLSTGGVLRARSAAFVWQLLDTPPARIEIYCQAQARPIAATMSRWCGTPCCPVSRRDGGVFR